MKEVAALIRNAPGGVWGVDETIGVALCGWSLTADYRLHIPTISFWWMMKILMNDEDDDEVKVKYSSGFMQSQPSCNC